MENKRLDENAARLTDLQRHLQRELVEVGAANSAAAQVTRDPGDDADHASDWVEQDAGARILSVLASNAQQVERALELLHGGLYGHCEDCGQEIPAERLQAVPEATRCLGCQMRRDQLGAPGSA